MDRRALDGRARAGRDRADPARDAEAREAERLSGVAAHPVVRKVLERFPGAKIVDVRAPEAPAAAPPPAPPATTKSAMPIRSIADDDF